MTEPVAPPPPEVAAIEEALSALTSAYQSASENMRSLVTGSVTVLWNELGAQFNNRAAARFAEQAAALVGAAQQYEAELTTAYMAEASTMLEPVDRREQLLTDVEPATEIRRDIRPQQVYHRPFVTARTALSVGHPPEVADKRARERLAELVETDLQLAHTHTAQRAMRRSGMRHFRRVLSPHKVEHCGLCILASTQVYSRENLSPIHPECRCTVRPLSAKAARQQTVDPHLVREVHEAIERRFGVGAVDFGGRKPADYRKVMLVREHGELGPVLTVARHKFTGPDALRFKAKTGRELDLGEDRFREPEPIAAQAEEPRRVAEADERVAGPRATEADWQRWQADRDVHVQADALARRILRQGAEELPKARLELADLRTRPDTPLNRQLREAAERHERNLTELLAEARRKMVLPEFDPDNPLKFYGDRLVIEDRSAIAERHLFDLEYFTPDTHRLLRDHFAESERGGFYLGDKRVPDLDELKDLRRLGREYDENVLGVYRNVDRVCGCGSLPESRVTLTALHEGAHAVDDAIRVRTGERASASPEFRSLWDRVLRHTAQRMMPHYSPAGHAGHDTYYSEAFAQGYAAWSRHRDEGEPDDVAFRMLMDDFGVTRFTRELNDEIGPALVAYFTGLERSLPQ